MGWISQLLNIWSRYLIRISFGNHVYLCPYFGGEEFCILRIFALHFYKMNPCFEYDICGQRRLETRLQDKETGPECKIALKFGLSLATETCSSRNFCILGWDPVLYEFRGRAEKLSYQGMWKYFSYLSFSLKLVRSRFITYALE